MKLIFCKKCNDVIKLRYKENSLTCQCGASGGYYLKDGLHAKIWGEAIPLGIDNISLKKAILCRNLSDKNYVGFFDAFVIPKKCDTVKEKN